MAGRSAKQCSNLPRPQVFESGDPVKCQPLAYWEFRDCFDYLEKYGLEGHPLHKQVGRQAGEQTDRRDGRTDGRTGGADGQTDGRTGGTKEGRAGGFLSEQHSILTAGWKDCLEGRTEASDAKDGFCLFLWTHGLIGPWLEIGFFLGGCIHWWEMVEPHRCCSF
jgi:3'-phosphoadenosine 5'-phosphosulfate sulfotransferase (PAPS reductase)/FAD synthetase